MGFFESWDEVLRMSVSTVVVYFFVIFLIRLAGKRSASKMNNFDWIVTVAIGSMVSTVILVPQVHVVGGLIAIMLLVGLQFVITSVATQSPFVNNLIRAQPKLLYYQGRWMKKALRTERLARAEVISAARAQGLANLDDVQAIVFESSAELSFLGKSEHRTPVLLEDVQKQDAWDIDEGEGRISP